MVEQELCDLIQSIQTRGCEEQTTFTIRFPLFQTKVAVVRLSLV